MITATDIKQLKKDFATKAELQDVKSELKAEIIALRVEFKQDLRREIDTLRKEFKKDLQEMARFIIKEIGEIVSGHETRLIILESKTEKHSSTLGQHSHQWSLLRDAVNTDTYKNN